jgi:hypothetical protein
MNHTNFPSLRHSHPLFSFIIANQYFCQMRHVKQSVNYLLQVRQAAESASIRRLLLLSDRSSRLPWMCCSSKTCWRIELASLLDSCPFQISGGTHRETHPPPLAPVASIYSVPPLPCAQTHHTSDQTEPTEGGLQLASEFWLWRRHFKQISLDNNRQGILAVAT